MRLGNNMSWIDREVTRIKKQFIKANKEGGTFHTAKGEVNTIEKIDNEYIYIKCKTKEDSNYKIRRKSLTAAINHLYFKKNLKRNELSCLSNYNTALFGLVIEILKNKITVEKDKIDKRSCRILLKGVRYIPSGMCKAGAKDWLAMKKLGIKTVMISFYYAAKSLTWYLWCIALDMYVIVDSGAFTIARKGKGEICINEYADFIMRYSSRIHSFMNLDVVGDAEKSKNNFKILRELTGMNPVPVWHPSQDWENSDWDNLKEMVDTNKIVAIGGTNKKFFKDDNKGTRKKALFKKIFELHPYGQFHYLGGSSQLILEDLWINGQADSSGWIRGRNGGQIYTFNGHKATETRPNHVSPEEALLYNLQTLTGFERSYGNYKTPIGIDSCLNILKNIYKEILINENELKQRKNNLRRLLKLDRLYDNIGEKRLYNKLTYGIECPKY